MADKSVGDLLRELDAKWNDGLAHPMPTLMWPEQVRRIAAVLDAADAMRATVDWKPYSDDFDAVEAQDREFQRATAAYDAARAELAEALKEGR